MGGFESPLYDNGTESTSPMAAVAQSAVGARSILVRRRDLMIPYQKVRFDGHLIQELTINEKQN
jgi:hypothetical protein